VLIRPNVNAENSGTMNNWQSFFEHFLVSPEKFDSFVDKLSFFIGFVPGVIPTSNYGGPLMKLSGERTGTLALTTRRLIVAMSEEGGWKYLHIPVINNLTERPLRSDKPNWPYQTIVMIPGGMGLVVQAQTSDKKQCECLSLLLVKSLLRLGAQRDVNDAETAIIVEEERRRQQQNKSYHDRDRE
jgi:hypothetical protein